MGKSVIIAGSRGITDETLVLDAIEEAPFEIETVVSGCANGVDSIGIDWAEENNIEVDRYPIDKYESEDVDTEGMPVPLYRNLQMAKTADALIAVWNGESNGTAHMIETAEFEGLDIHISRPFSHSLSDF